MSNMSSNPDYQVFDKQGRLQELGPLSFVNKVLIKCGVNRQKDQRSITVERGSDFFRKINHLKSSDPCGTYFGKDSMVANNIIGGEELDLSSLSPERDSAMKINNKKGSPFLDKSSQPKMLNVSSGFNRKRSNLEMDELTASVFSSEFGTMPRQMK